MTGETSRATPSAASTISFMTHSSRSDQTDQLFLDQHAEALDIPLARPATGLALDRRERPQLIGTLPRLGIGRDQIAQPLAVLDQRKGENLAIRQRKRQPAAIHRHVAVEAVKTG